jgi:hypothetical protein
MTLTDTSSSGLASGIQIGTGLRRSFLVLGQFGIGQFRAMRWNLGFSRRRFLLGFVRLRGHPLGNALSRRISDAADF